MRSWWKSPAVKEFAWRGANSPTPRLSLGWILEVQQKNQGRADSGGISTAWTISR